MKRFLISFFSFLSVLSVLLCSVATARAGPSHLDQNQQVLTSTGLTSSNNTEIGKECVLVPDQKIVFSEAVYGEKLRSGSGQIGKECVLAKSQEIVLTSSLDAQKSGQSFDRRSNYG